MRNKKTFFILSLIIISLLFSSCGHTKHIDDIYGEQNEEIIVDKEELLIPENNMPNDYETLAVIHDNFDNDEVLNDFVPEAVVGNDDIKTDNTTPIVSEEIPGIIISEEIDSEKNTEETTNKTNELETTNDIQEEKTDDKCNNIKEEYVVAENTENTDIIEKENNTEEIIYDVANAPETTIKEETNNQIITEVVEEKVIPKNSTIVMDKISSVESFLTYPKEEDFGDNYNKAVLLYDSILQRAPEIKIDFENEWDEMNNFMDKFEKNVMNNLFVASKTFISGAYNYITLNPSNIYDEIMAFNEYIDVVKSLDIDEYVDQKDAVIKINNWIIDNIEYQLNQKEPYFAYLNKKANCDGYARLFQRFCKVIGVECTWESGRVKGDGKYGLHAWNKVKLDNEWYYIDVCWNDSNTRNKYLLSPTLWYNHHSKVDVNITVPDDKPKGKSILFNNEIKLEDILKVPTEDIFGVNYDAALAIYNGILNNDKYVSVPLYKSETDANSFDTYNNFAADFQKYVLSSSMDFKYSTINWMDKEYDVKLTANTHGMNAQLMGSIREFEEYHKANIAAGVQEGMTEMEAIVKILNWMTQNLDYDNYASKNSVEALTSGKADYRWYAEIFYYMCKNVGIDCEIINGLHIPNGRRVAALWNKVKIGDTWYYMDLWYYSITSYTDAEKLEYFLSEELWENHEIDVGISF